MNLNISYRKWFIDRYVKELEAVNGKKKENDDVSSDNLSNLSEYESMLNKKFSNE